MIVRVFRKLTGRFIFIEFIQVYKQIFDITRRMMRQCSLKAGGFKKIIIKKRISEDVFPAQDFLLLQTNERC